MKSCTRLHAWWHKIAKRRLPPCEANGTCSLECGALLRQELFHRQSFSDARVHVLCTKYLHWRPDREGADASTAAQGWIDADTGGGIVPYAALCGTLRWSVTVC